MSGVFFDLAEGVAILSASIAGVQGLRSVRTRRLYASLRELLAALDPQAELRMVKGPELRAAFALRGRRCDIEVVASAGWTTRWALTMGGPMSAILTLLGQDGTSNARTLPTGDRRFDQLFAVNAAAPGALRVLSDRVRAALVSLPPAMIEPRLSVEVDRVELAWHGRPARAALEQGHGLLSLVCEEFNALLPLR